MSVQECLVIASFFTCPILSWSNQQEVAVLSDTSIVQGILYLIAIMFAGFGEDDYVESMDTSDYLWYWFYEAACGIWHRTEVLSYFNTILLLKLFPICFYQVFVLTGWSSEPHQQLKIGNVLP